MPARACIRLSVFFCAASSETGPRWRHRNQVPTNNLVAFCYVRSYCESFNAFTTNDPFSCKSRTNLYFGRKDYPAEHRVHSEPRFVSRLGSIDVFPGLIKLIFECDDSPESGQRLVFSSVRTLTRSGQGCRMMIGPSQRWVSKPNRQSSGSK